MDSRTTTMLADEDVAKAFIMLHMEGDCPVNGKLESRNLVVDGYELRERKGGSIVARYSCGTFHVMKAPGTYNNTLQKYTSALFEHVITEYEKDYKSTLRDAIYRELDPVLGGYTQGIVDAIADDVIDDVVASAAGKWSDGDIHLAIGRVLCKRLGVES